MALKGLFNKIKNKPTRRKFVVSTICKEENIYETVVFEANFFYLPRSWKRPAFTVVVASRDEAWDLHYRLTARLTLEYPARLIQEYLELSQDSAPGASA
jgi:hypothetical protein